MKVYVKYCDCTSFMRDLNLGSRRKVNGKGKAIKFRGEFDFEAVAG